MKVSLCSFPYHSDWDCERGGNIDKKGRKEEGKWTDNIQCMRGEANKKERKEQQDIQKEDHENHSIPRTKMKTFSKGRAIERSKACWQVKSDRTRIWFPFLTAWRSYLLRSFSFWGDGNYRLYHVPAVPPQAQRTHSWLTCRYPSCNNLRTRSDNAHNVQSFCFCALKIWDLQMWFEYTFFFFFLPSKP